MDNVSEVKKMSIDCTNDCTDGDGNMCKRNATSYDARTDILREYLSF